MPADAIAVNVNTLDFTYDSDLTGEAAALGTAGSPSASVLTVQGVTSGTPQPISCTALVPGTAATNLGKAEDAAHTSGDVGVMALAVRKATAADLSAGATDGDYEPLQVDANGCLHVTSRTLTQATATLANVNDTASSTTLLASNSAARGRAIYNDSTSILYLKFGATASTTSFTVAIPAAGYYEFPSPLYTGIVDGIWSADASGAARTTEW